jgi:hypothetical protein
MEQWLLENEPDSKFLVNRAGGRFLDPGVVVHHRDEIKTNNRIENLSCMTPSEHRQHHNAERKLAVAFWRAHGSPRTW